MASEKTVTTVTEEKTNKYEINKGRRSYISEPTSASRDPVASLYSYLERKETLNVPDELQVPNRVVYEEERNNFGGSTPNNKNTSVNTELQDSGMTSQLNPDAAEFVPVSPSRFMMDPVSYTHLDVYKRQG